ncbi:bactericidal permeability-increasing protein-like isoform X1 [Pleurodeles waltl]
MLQKTFWAAALLCTVLGSEASNPGLKGRITGKALEEVNKIGLDVLKSRLKEMTIPDQAGQYRMSWMMTAYYEVSGIQIQDLQIPESSMRFIPGKGIELSIKNTIMKITGRWTAKLWFMNPGGSFDVFVSGLSLSSVLGATRDDSGRPSVREGSCSTTIGELRVTFKDGMSWLYNLFRKSLERPLRDLLYSKSCAAVRKMITDLDQILRTMPVSVQIDQSAVFDYSLLEAPLITDQYSELDFKGEFYSSKHARDPNFSPAPFSMPDQTGQMLYFGLSESFFNSAAFAYFTSGVMQVNLTQNKIPLNSPILLKTDDFENLIPEIPRQYPHLGMMLQLSARKQPLLTCLPGSLHLTGHGYIRASAILPNATLAPLFEIDLDTVIKGQVMISGQKLNGSLDLDSFRLSLVHSDVGPLEVDTLQAMLSEVLQILVLPEVNKILSRGFLLPTINGLTLVNPSVTVLKGLVIFGADGHFSV